MTPGGNPRPGARWFRVRGRSRSALEAQLREELDSHLALAVDYLVSRGVPRDRAEREARDRFGDWNGALDRLYLSARTRESRSSAPFQSPNRSRASRSARSRGTPRETR